MICKALIGCRIKHQDPDEFEEGIIIGSSMNSNGTIFIAIMKDDMTFTDIKLSNAIINKEDYRKIIQQSKPEPIDNRFEIMDI